MQDLKHFFGEIEEKNIEFLEILRDQNSSFRFNLTQEGLTEYGKRISLGFSCYALKLYFILGYWEKLDQNIKSEWLNFIKKFQKNTENYENNIFEDSNYINGFNDIKLSKKIKNVTKISLNNLGLKKYLNHDQILKNSLRAETKQAISSLYQVNEKNIFTYREYKDGDDQLLKYLNSLNWQNPWASGGQFSSLCVFSRINEEKVNSKILSEFSDKLVSKENGAYYIGKTPNNTLLINGAMKIISGLDWIDKDIQYPNKLIDLCLSIDPFNGGCDIVDLVYVIYKSQKNNKYKKKEIIDYLLNIIEKIETHYFDGTGGFSYFEKRCQTEYYGVKISKSLIQPDLHGTLLLVWALSMISEIIELDDYNWNILKP